MSIVTGFTVEVKMNFHADMEVVWQRLAHKYEMETKCIVYKPMSGYTTMCEALMGVKIVHSVWAMRGAEQ